MSHASDSIPVTMVAGSTMLATREHQAGAAALAVVDGVAGGAQLDAGPRVVAGAEVARELGVGSTRHQQAQTGAGREPMRTGLVVGR